MSLLDDIRNQVGSGLIGAGLAKPAVLTKVTPGTRTPGALSAGTNPTTQTFPVQGIDVSTVAMAMAGTLITGVSKVIKLYGSTVPSGVTPGPGDKITMDGVTYTIAADDGGKQAVTSDAARAAWTCQCRG